MTSVIYTVLATRLGLADHRPNRASPNRPTRAAISGYTHVSAYPTLCCLFSVARHLSVWLSACVLVTVVGSSRAHSAIPEDFDPILLYGSTASYKIARNQKSIGRHTVSFTKPGNDTLNVSINSNLKVTLLGIPVYRFKYSAQEKWSERELQSVTATTTEKGTSKTVSMQRDGDLMRLINGAGEVSNEILEHSSNHWNPAVLQSSRIFNTLSGKPNQVTISEIGREILQINNQPTPATHYQYTGELNVDVWYDDQRRWVKLAFKADDGSAIVYLSEGFPTP